MLDRVLSARLRDYAPASPLEQENVLQELMQHYVLASLSRAGLFGQALFHGGTCLRIVHAMNRFSEDLDFLLEHMEAAIRHIDWTLARHDVQRFLPVGEQEGLRAWSAAFFLYQLARMAT